MNMKLPRFTAEASLSRVGGHYRSSRQALGASAQITSGIYASLMGEEVITIHSCLPGWTDIGGVCFPPPLTEPTGGSGEGGSSVGEPGGSGGGGKGGGGRGGGGRGGDEEIRVFGCTFEQFQSSAASSCRKKKQQDAVDGLRPELHHFLRCDGTKMECCHRHQFRDVCEEVKRVKGPRPRRS